MARCSMNDWLRRHMVQTTRHGKDNPVPARSNVNHPLVERDLWHESGVSHVFKIQSLFSLACLFAFILHERITVGICNC